MGKRFEKKIKCSVSEGLRRGLKTIKNSVSVGKGLKKIKCSVPVEEGIETNFK